MQKILSRHWRGPHVSEGFSRAHGWLLDLKTGEPTRSSGPLAGVAPESGASNRAAHVLIHAERGHPKAVCGEKAPVPSTTCYLAGGLPAPQATDPVPHPRCTERIGSTDALSPHVAADPGAGTRCLRLLTEHTPEATPRHRSGPRLSHRAPTLELVNSLPKKISKFRVSASAFVVATQARYLQR